MSVTEQTNRQRRVRRNTWVLVALAIGVYVAFIAAGVIRSQGGL